MQWGNASDDQLSHHAEDPKDYRNHDRLMTSMIRLVELCFWGDPAASLVPVLHVNKTREVRTGTMITGFTRNSPYRAHGSLDERRESVRALEPLPVIEQTC